LKERARDLPTCNSELPLVGYACNSWPAHIRMREGNLSEKEFWLVKDFLECPERITWFRTRTYDDYDRDGEVGYRSIRDLTIPEWQQVRQHLENTPATPLFYAARLGLIHVVKALLHENGVHLPPSTYTSSQRLKQSPTPDAYGNELRAACFYEHEEMVDLLLRAGADVNSVGGTYGNAIGACMHAKAPNPAIIEKLIEHGAFVTLGDWITGWVLRRAAMQGHLSLAALLVSKMDLTEPQDYLWTKEYMSMFRSGPSFYHKGLYGRADFEGRGSYPNHGTAPYEAASAGHDEILALLLNSWSAVDEVDYEGRTALYWASFYGHAEVVRQLLEKGARCAGHRLVAEWTPLYWARMRGHREIERLLAESSEAEAKK
jgi:ankyrin repeat protein